MLLASDNPHIVYGGLVEVVDAAEFDATRGRHPEIDRHLGVADLVVLNKTDRIEDEEQSRIRKAIAATGSGAAVISATYGRIDPELLFDPALRPDGEERMRQLTFEDLLLEDGRGQGRRGTRGASARRVRECLLHLRRAHEPPPADGVPRLPARGPLPDQGVRRLRRGRPRQHIRAARRRQIPAVRPPALEARRTAPHPARADRLRHRPGHPAQGAGRLSRERRTCSPDTAPHAAMSPDTPQDAAHEQSMWGVLRYVQQPVDDA